MQSNKLIGSYFNNREAAHEDANTISTFQYSCQFNPNQNDKRQIALLKLLRVTSPKDYQEIKLFFDGFPLSPNKMRDVQKQNLQMSKDEIRASLGDILVMIMKELVTFYSYIDRHTTKYNRMADIYSRAHLFFIKIETVEKKTLNNSQQETEQSKQQKQEQEQKKEGLIIRMSFKIRKSDYPKQDVSLTKLQSDYVEEMFQMKSIQNRINILRGEDSTFYIVNLKQSVGRGGFGQVYKGQSIQWTKDGEVASEQWAIKTCKKNVSEYKQSGYSISQEREHEILTHMSALIDKKRLKAGEYIIKCKEKITQNDKKHIIYEYCSENSLREFSKNGRRLTIKNIYEIAYQLIQVMKLIHFDLIKTEDQFYKLSVNIQNDNELEDDTFNFMKVKNKQNEQKGIIHRDLKLNNVLVKEISNYHIKIKVIDWAFCKRTYTGLKLNKIHCGTLQYQAPEIEEKVRYDSKVDIWAFGAIIFELLNNRPFIDKTKKNNINIKKNFRNQIQNMQFTNFQQLQQESRQFWRQLLLGALSYEPDSRWSAQNLYQYMSQYPQYECSSSVTIKKAVQLKEAKDVMMYLFGKLQAEAASKGKLVKQLFYKYVNSLSERAQHQINKEMSCKINLQSSLISILNGKCKNDKYGGSQIYSQKVMDFLKKNFKEIKQLQACLRFIFAKCQN